MYVLDDSTIHRMLFIDQLGQGYTKASFEMTSLGMTGLGMNRFRYD